MSHYRRLSGGKRDSNETAIRKRFARHGWHTEQLSGTSIPDLLCWPMNPASAVHDYDGLAASVLVDVKEPTGKPTPAQAEKWKALSDKGIPVYVARTSEDVDTIVAGSAEPWGVVEARPKLGKAIATVAANAGKSLHVVREPGSGKKRAPRPAYTPPEATRMHTNAIRAAAASIAKAKDGPIMREVPRAHVCGKNGCRKHRPCEVHDVAPALSAAKKAEATFAPGPDEPETCRVPDCDEQRVAHGYCTTHAIQGLT
jgi:hypothetical protein